MARLFTEGFETRNNQWFSSSINNTRFSTATVRTGGSKVSCSCSPGGDVRILSSAVNEFYVRIAFLSTDFALNSTYLLSWRYGENVLGRLYYDVAVGQKKFNLQVGTTSVAVGTRTIYSDVWYLLELHVKISDSTGSITLKVDGETDCTYTGDTMPDANTTVNNIMFKEICGGSGLTYIDDLAMNDTAGGVDNSWCGDGHIVLLPPKGDGISSQFVGSDGNSTSNYLLVDDWTNGAVADDDTTYVQSGTLNYKDLYALNGSLADVSVSRVWVEGRIRDTVAATGTAALILKASTEYDSSDISLLTSYANYKSSEYLVNPDTSNAWSLSDVNGLQVGVKVRSV